MMKCTEYVHGDWRDEHEYYFPPNCPVCGGFLKFEGNNPICNKCKTELIMLPYTEDGIEYEWGKICPISLPSSEVKPE